MPRRSAYEVVVVGAGAIGLACGWRAAELGLSVLVIDREAAGAGASGVAAGMLAPVTEAEFTERELLELNLAGARRWPSFDAELAARAELDTGYAATGALVVAADRDDAEELRRLHDFQRSLGLDAEWLGARELRRLEPRLSPRVAGGIAAPADHQVDPRALLRALRAALERSGGELATGVEVTALTPAGVETGAGRLRARSVVLAAGSWSGALAEVPVRPVKGQILRLRGEARFTRAVVRTPRCYVVARASGEVVVGATQEERGFDTRVTAGGARELLDAAAEVLPDVDELELVEASARLRPATPDNLPLIGPSGHDGLVLATGHHRNGVLLAPITADAVARVLTGEDAGLPACAADRFAAARSAA